MKKVCLIINTFLLTITCAFVINAGEINKANADLSGDGKTDLVNIRGASSSSQLAGEENANNVAKSYRERVRKQQAEGLVGTSTQLLWSANVNGSAEFSETPFGIIETDIIIAEDFDGDNKDDLTVWRQGVFYILQSLSNTVRIESFGRTGDDPTVSGDYDGDNKADIAVFRCPSFGQPAAQCFFYYRGSLNNPSGNITFIPWGFGSGSDLYANPGDFDGDGKYDFCLQRDDGNGQGQFVLLRSSDFRVEFINWGTPDDIIAPGDYDGDGKSDFMVVRNTNGQHNWFLLERDGGGTGGSPIIFGIAATDFITPGDYDGDGKTDVAVWRGSFVPNQSLYYAINSSDSAIQTFNWGRSGDYPVANWYVH
jgi:hypothetical protein